MLSACVNTIFPSNIIIRQAGFNTLVLAANATSRHIPTTILQKHFYLFSKLHYKHNNNINYNFSTKLYSSFSCSSQSSTNTTMHLQYPLVRRDESIVDDYHGVLVSDPYRWLEDPDAEEVKDFVQKQVNLGESVFRQCETREKLQKKLTEFYDYPKYEAPYREGDKYFYFHNTGLQPQKVLYMQDRLDAQPEVLLDPNELSEDGTVALSTCAVSKDAKYLAYALSSSGSDWVTIKIMGIQDKKVHNDTLLWVKFSGINWTHDNKGFFLLSFPISQGG